MFLRMHEIPTTYTCTLMLCGGGRRMYTPFHNGTTIYLFSRGKYIIWISFAYATVSRRLSHYSADYTIIIKSRNVRIINCIL